jgi:hypothetical protein
MQLRIAILSVVAFALIGIGCQTDRPMETSPDRAIPRAAVFTKQGQGRLWYQAVFDGVAYVYDADTAKLVFAAPMKKNDRLVIEPTRDRATVEGKAVFEKPLPRTHTYRIYYEPYGKPPPVPKEPEVLSPLSPPASE